MSGDTVKNRGIITAAMVTATMMITLDSTIANVALPHIQGSLSAAPDQITWVLTAYIVASAMMTPVSGWIANRVGTKTVLLATVTGFTVSSMLCGVATSLPELVVFRLAQGAFGAFTVPLSQAVLLNIYPPEQQSRAMSLWAMGTLIGPIIGPIVGGYLTEQISWRWCFFINLPIGALAVASLWLFMPSTRSLQARRFDFLGFGALIVAVGAFQLMLDRGPGQDWFNASEIWTEALIALISFWIFLSHTVTTAHPFVDKTLLRDRNLVTASLFGFVVQGVMFGTLALLPLLMQTLMGYPVLTSGVINIPRSLGMGATMWMGPMIMRWIGARATILLGIAVSAVCYAQMSRFDLSMGSEPLLLTNLLSGMAQGLIFLPLTSLAFATIRPEMRNEGAALFNLMRNIGASVGISVMVALATNNTQAMHASLAAKATPDDPVFRWGLDKAFSPDTIAGATALDAQINRQATMVAYVDDFRLMFVLTLLTVPLVLFLRGTRAKPDPTHAAME